MITSVNKKINPEYLKLYAAVEEYMKTHDEKGVEEGKEGFTVPMMTEDTFITSLDELFSHMKELRKVKPQLTRLPLDEPCFEIDANTRVISIPDNFSRSGAFSVEGDEIAESVYFRINRFYDHTDLATQEIFIQYTNAKGEQSASVPPMVDIESDPGYIIFEWPISSKVTKAAGTVQFSVRFFTYDNTELDEDGRGGKIIYSLSTLPATAQVKASQNFDLIHIEEEDISLREDNSVLMKDRLINSPLYGDAATFASTPVFWPDYSLPEVMNLGVDEDGFTTLPVEFPVQAYSEEGQINYYWTKTDLENVSKEMDFTPKMIPTEDTKPVEGKVYYVSKTDSVGKITGYSLVGVIEDFDEEKDYFERVSIGTIDSVGYYQAEATNRVKNAIATEITPNTENTKQCWVPAATEPVMKDISNKLILAFNDETDCFEGTLKDTSATKDNGGKLTWLWYYSEKNPEEEGFDEEKDWAPLKEGADVDSQSLLIQGASVSVPVLNEDGTEKIDEGPITENGKLEVGDNDPFENLISVGNGIRGKLNGTDEDVIFSPSVENAHASGDGYYKVEVVNNLNKTTNSLFTNICRVTHTAIKPDVNHANGMVGLDERVKIDSKVATSTENGGLKVTASIPEFAAEKRTPEDSITYQWYRYSNLGEDSDAAQAKLDADGKKAAEGRYVLDNDFRVKGATSPTLVLTEADLTKGNVYFCRVLNTYNGTKAVRCSRFFEITTFAN